MRYCLLMTALLFSLVSWRPTQAQNPKQPQVQREGIQCIGTVKDVGAGVFQLRTDEGEEWLIKVEARPQDISYTASADASFLRPGLFVRLSSKLNGRGQTADKISDLTIVTPKPDAPPGLNTEPAAPTDPNLFNDPKAEKRSKPRPKAGADPTYDIVGRIAKATKAELTIDAGGTPVRVQLADKLSVSLDVADLSYLRSGDKVELTGWKVAGEKGRGYATKLTVTAAQPLTDASAAPKKGRTSAAAEKKQP